MATMENLDKGYVKMCRSIMEHWLYPHLRKFTEFEAWVDLIMLCNHSDRKVGFEKGFIEIKRGEHLTSLQKIGLRWMWGMSETRTFLNALEKDGMIVKKSTSKYTKITICNYGFYQDVVQTKNKPKTNGKQTDDKPNDTNKTLEGINNELKEIVYSDVMDFFNRNKGQVSAIKVMTESRKKHIKARVDEMGIDCIYVAIEKMRDSDFLQGKKGDWKADFDWLFNPGNFAKIIEGKYDNKADTAPAFVKELTYKDMEKY